MVAKCRIVVTFSFVSGLRVSKVSTVRGIGAVQVAKRRTVVIVGVVLRRVLVAKHRIVVFFEFVSGLHVLKCQYLQGWKWSWSRSRAVVTSGLVSGLRVSKVSAVTGIGGVVVAKRRIVIIFDLASGQRRGEKRNKRRERKGEKSEERRDRREERRRREEKREGRGEKR